MRITPGLLFVLIGNSRGFLQCPHRHMPYAPLQKTFSFDLRSTEQSVDAIESPSDEKTDTPFWKARQDCWRPDVRDVEKISWGMTAKKKGTGSRGTPHRLNAEERRAFDQARRQGFLQVKGSSWRAQRRDAPLLNSYRSLMDAQGRPVVVLHKRNPTSGSADGEDILVVDLSPLRYPDEFDRVAHEVKTLVKNELQIEAQHDVEESIVEQENEDELINELQSELDNTMYETRPIYQIPSFSIQFEVSRSQGKQIGKLLATTFDTIEEKATKSKKPKGVKPGKSRRHGGYGIG